jgi:hypothetical protein
VRNKLGEVLTIKEHETREGPLPERPRDRLGKVIELFFAKMGDCLQLSGKGVP